MTWQVSLATNTKSVYSLVLVETKRCSYASIMYHTYNYTISFFVSLNLTNFDFRQKLLLAKFIQNGSSLHNKITKARLFAHLIACLLG